MAYLGTSKLGGSSLVIGLNSGTSTDGVDAVLMKISDANDWLVMFH